MKPKPNNNGQHHQQTSSAKIQRRAVSSDRQKDKDDDVNAVAETGDDKRATHIKRSLNIPGNTSDDDTSASTCSKTSPQSNIPSDVATTTTTATSTSDDHVTYDVVSGPATADEEVADILQSVPDASKSDFTDAEVKGDVTGHDEVVTEVIMTKTFTESIQPDREFVPIGGDDVTSERLPAEPNVRLTVRCELSQHASTSGADKSMTSSSRQGEVATARGQVRDLMSELRHLQTLLDDLTSPVALATSDGTAETSSDEEDFEGSRVVYRYHLRGQDTQTTGRRWVRRSDANQQELPQSTDDDVRTEETVCDSDVMSAQLAHLSTSIDACKQIQQMELVSEQGLTSPPTQYGHTGDGS